MKSRNIDIKIAESGNAAGMILFRVSAADIGKFNLTNVSVNITSAFKTEDSSVSNDCPLTNFDIQPAIAAFFFGVCHT